MKRILSLLLAALLCFSLCACALQTPTTLADEIALPADGLLSSQVLFELREKRQAVAVRGETDGVSYTWTLFGTKIETPRDCNFALTKLRVNGSKIKLAFASKESFGFAPLLTLFLPQMPAADVAAVYRAPAKEENYVCAATVTSAKSGGTVSFAVADPTGSYVIELLKSETPQPTTADAEIEEEPQTAAAPQRAATTKGESAAAPQTTAAQTTTAPAASRPVTTHAATTAARTTAQQRPGNAAAARTTTAPATTTTAAPQAMTCSLSIECGTVFQHLSELETGKLDALPADGVILPAQSVEFSEGESVFDVLQRVCRNNGIQMEASFVPLYQSAYVEGIGNLYEFDCGEGSGWMYRVNGVYPNYGCSRYLLQSGDVVEFRYTCDLGADVGGKNNFS